MSDTNAVPTGQRDSSPGPRDDSRDVASRRLLRTLVTGNVTWVFLALIIVMAFFTAAAPGKFLTANDLSLISQTTAPFLLMAIGQTFVIITAGIDLSVGFVLVLSGVVAGEYYLSHGGANAGIGTIWIGALIGLAIGAGFGALQGILVA